MTQPNSYILRCLNCGARNRIPLDKVGLTAHCGKCQKSIQTDILRMDSPLIITDSDFHSQIIKCPLPVLLDCWAAWCGPCRMIAKSLDELASEWQGKIRVAKLNVDENPRTASQYQIQSIPTMLIFDNGHLQNRLTGALPKNSIRQAMSNYF